MTDKRDKNQQQIIRFAFSDIKYSGVHPRAYINAKILCRKHCYCNSLFQPVLLRYTYQTKPNHRSVHFQMPFRNSNLAPQNETSLFLSFNPHSYLIIWFYRLFVSQPLPHFFPQNQQKSFPGMIHISKVVKIIKQLQALIFLTWKVPTKTQIHWAGGLCSQMTRKYVPTNGKEIPRLQYIVRYLKYLHHPQFLWIFIFTGSVNTTNAPLEQFFPGQTSTSRFAIFFLCTLKLKKKKKVVFLHHGRKRINCA